MPNFDIEFQVRMLAVSVREPAFLSFYSDVLRPGIFSTNYLRDLSTWVLEHYKKFKNPPTLNTLRKIVNDNIPDKSPLAEGYKILLDRIYSADLTDTAYIQEQMITAAKYLSCKTALIQMAEQNERMEFEELPRTLDQALRVGIGVGDIGLELTKDMAQAVFKFNSEQAIKTGFTELEKAIGGFYVGEETIIVAPPNVGKTALLGNLAYGAARRDTVVLYYTLEIGAERMLCRFYSKMAALPTRYLRANIDIIESNIKRFQLSTQGTVYVKFFPARGASVDTLRNHLSMVIGQGIKPSLIIVDYADLLRPSRASNNKARTDELLRENHEELRAMGNEFNVHIMSASQSTRDTLYADYIDLDKMAEGWSKAFTADVVVALCQNVQEQEATVARLYVAKARNETKGSIIHVATQYKRLDIHEIDKKKYARQLSDAGFETNDDGNLIIRGKKRASGRSLRKKYDD